MWYYTLDGQQTGPVTQAELAQKLNGGLPSDTLVWKEGMSEWRQASTTVEFGNLTSIDAAASYTPPKPEEPAEDESNPYASPSSDVVNHTNEQAATELPAEPVKLDIGFCINQGWKHTMRNFGLVFLTGFVYVMLIGVVSGVLSSIGAAIDGPQVVAEIDYESMEPSEAFFAAYAAESQMGPAQGISEIISQVFQLFLAMGLTAFALTHVRGGEASVGQLFSQGWKKVLKVIGASIIYYLAVAVGTLFLIIPGIYIAIRYMYYQTAIVDNDLGVMESLQYSSELTRENKWRIFGLGVINFFIVIAGFLALFIGLIWAIPVVVLAHTISYCYLHAGERSIAVQS